MSRLPLRLASIILPIVVVAALLAGPLAALADGIIIVDPPPCGGQTSCPTPPPCEPLTGCVPCPADRPCPWPPCPPGVLCPRPTDYPRQTLLQIKYHHVTVTIDNQVATTQVDQVFYNPNSWAVEGSYVFPVPRDAVVSDFALWVDGQKVEAKIMDARQARQTYENIVRTQRDPALLEYVGLGALQATIFPIPPQGERRIQIQYSQVLTAESGLVHYVYPLNTEKFSSQPLESVSISVSVKSRDAIRAVYSPSHKIAVDRPDAYSFTAGYEAKDVTPDQNFDLFYSVSSQSIGLNLLTYRDPAGGDGYFVLLAAPGVQTDQPAIAKDVLLVLDTSGSMDGKKIDQAKSALTYVLNHLNPDDRFNVIAFSTGVQSFARDLQPAGQAAVAADWVAGLNAEGGTNIDRALMETMASADHGRPAIVIFLTDGLPTDGVTDTAQILGDVSKAAPSNVRLFSFGVGDDVDTVLLDSLAEQNHGASAYVRPHDDIAEAVSGFYNKVQTPVLADLKLDFGSLKTSDVYPDPLPDLFAGSQLVLAGRYRDGGTATVTLTGDVNGEPQTFTFPEQAFAGSGGSDFVPRLWATRKIGYLLNQIRLKGEQSEWVKAIVELSVRFGIVTPYTSYLVTENGVLSSAQRDQIAAAESQKLLNAPVPASGGAAVDAAVTGNSMQQAETVDKPVDNAAEAVKFVGTRTFLSVDGVWTDTQFDPSQMKTRRIDFGSDEYFTLAASRADFASAFALGRHVIVLVDGQAYEVVPNTLPLATSATDQATKPTLAPEATNSETAPTAIAIATQAAPAGTLPPAPPATMEPELTAPASARGLPWAAIVVGLGALGLLGLFGWRRRRP